MSNSSDPKCELDPRWPLTCNRCRQQMHLGSANRPPSLDLNQEGVRYRRNNLLGVRTGALACCSVPVLFLPCRNADCTRRTGCPGTGNLTALGHLSAGRRGQISGSRRRVPGRSLLSGAQPRNLKQTLLAIPVFKRLACTGRHRSEHNPCLPGT